MPEIAIPKESSIFKAFDEIAKEKKCVFFAGLPGVGKSFFLQQLSLMAHASGRDVHLLQWDVTRAAFEHPEILAKYPEVEGVTHPAIRKAVGLWARSAVASWYEAYRAKPDILIGEVPLIGNRLSELVQPMNDNVEGVLAGETTLFVLPVPSERVRNVIESSRRASIANPRHERERADAPPNVLEMLWLEIADLAKKQGGAPPSQHEAKYDPHLYAEVYEKLLRHRRIETFYIDETFSSTASVYELGIVKSELTAGDDEVNAIFEELEEKYSSGELNKRLLS